MGKCDSSSFLNGAIFCWLDEEAEEAPKPGVLQGQKRERTHDAGNMR